jgi:hypothetical protein
MAEQETKSFFLSVTFWGVVLSVVGKGLYAAGYDIGDTTGLAELVVSFVGDALALYGRARATKKITV